MVKVLVFSKGVLALVALVANPPTASASECDDGKPNFLWDANLKDCVQIFDPSQDPLAFKCKSHLQCVKGSLGPMSRCNPETRLCECYDKNSDGQQPTGIYDGRCVVRKYLDDFCSEDIECKAGVHPIAVCASSDNVLPHEKVCICPPGRSCKRLYDTCKTDNECQKGIGQNAECVMIVGELACACRQGKTCSMEDFEDGVKTSITLIVGIVVGVLAAAVVFALGIFKVVQSRRNKRFTRVYSS